jgi:glycosyltransferase involved in cell wall biosynthesis
MADHTEGLTFILPAFDQEKVLAKVVGGWIPVLDSLRRPYEILIVDDGSQDGTKAQAEILAAKNPRIKLLAHSERKGFGASLRTAIEASTHPLVFYTSSDHGWHPSDLPRMMKSLEIKDEFTGKQVELVNGHRRGTVWPPARKRLNTVKRWLTRIVLGFMPDPPRGYLGATESKYWWRCRILFGLRLGDINSKFKLIRRSVLDRMVLQSDGEFIHAEILAKANFLGVMIDEVVLGDKEVPAPAPDVRKEMWRVFHEPKFRANVPPVVETPVAPVA